MAVATASLYAELERRGLAIRAIDVGPGRWRGLRRLPVKLQRHLWAAVRVAKQRPRHVILGADGGSGMLLQIPLLLACRLAHAHVCATHHSRLVSEQPHLSARLFIAASGKRVVHIFVSNELAHKFQDWAGAHRRVAVVSNAHTLVPPDAAPMARPATNRQQYVVGHMSNLTVAKGFVNVGLAIAELRRAGMPLLYIVAGTPVDKNALLAIEMLRLRLGDGLRLVGPVYGDEKRRFLRSLDVFAHPSHYRHECYAIAVWEALREGTPIVALRAGGLTQAAVGEGGIVLEPGASINEIAAALRKILTDASPLRDRATAAKAATAIDYARAMRQIDALTGRLTC